MLFSKFFGQLDHTRASFSSRCQNNFRAQTSHDLAALNRERVRHYRDELVALGGADHRQCNTRIARCRFNDDLARLQQATLFGVIDDRKCQPILDRCQRIKRFDFDVYVDVVRAHVVESYDRRIADGFKNIVVDHFIVIPLI